MHLDDFWYDLPKELIAQTPAEPRDSARLLVYDRRSKHIEHAQVRDLARFLLPQSLLIANNSRVRKARLFGQRTDGRPAELLLLEPIENDFYCMVGGRGIKINETIAVCADQHRQAKTSLTATVREHQNLPGMARYRISFSSSEPEAIDTLLERYGYTPLPPYISNKTTADERYQTVFASETGSAAAPTAGLHFTPELIESLKDQDFGWEEVTLHVGLGTFLPLREQEVTKNHLHQEQTFVSPHVAERITQQRQANLPVIAIGTTSTRTLEAHSQNGGLQPGQVATELFMYPGYRFQTVTGLFTNFHLPHSSLLLLVAAFLADQAVALTPQEAIADLQKIYATAIAEKYRFFSFGDAMLIL